AGWTRRRSSRSATGCTGRRRAAAAGRAAAAATAATGNEPIHLRGELSTMSERVREILSWYGSDNPGTLANLARLMNHGRLACSAIGFTISPASAARNEMYGQIRELAHEAKRKGLAVVIWSYPRGSGISKEGETAIDVVAYAAQIACQLGAHVVKVKPPTAH